MSENTLLANVVNYGLAGIVVFIFYKLLSNELKELRTSIDRLNESILRLMEKISQGGRG